MDVVTADDPDRFANDIAQFEAHYPFALDDFQREAIQILLAGDSVMVAAPTGTGKTVVADFGVWEAFKGTGRVIYHADQGPVEPEIRDLREVYGNEVGLLTGDVSENGDARVVVMTTEVLRNMLLQTPWDLDDVDTVIFDEIHYLADPERGTTWEESIILCPDHVQLICLSATINNADEIAAWISRTHRPIRLITHTERAVPLALHYFIDGKLNSSSIHTGALVRDFPHTGGELRRQAARGGFASAAPSAAPRNGRTAAARDRRRPRRAGHAAGNLLPLQPERLPGVRRAPRRSCAQTWSRLVNSISSSRPSRRFWRGLRPKTGSSSRSRRSARSPAKDRFHHAGLLPILKQLVEVLFGRGLMEVVFATDTWPWESTCRRAPSSSAA